MRASIIVLFVFAWLSCRQTDAGAQSKLKPDAFEAMLAKDSSVQLVDVRTPEEYAEGHLEGAQLVNFYAGDFTKRLEKLDKNKPVLVYCAVGGRSGKTAGKLTKMGFQQVYDLEGGIDAWQAGGKKTVQ